MFFAYHLHFFSQSLRNLSGENGILAPLVDDETFAKALNLWVASAKQVNLAKDEQFPQKGLNSSTFRSYVAEFLFLGGGLHYLDGVVFEEKLNCSEKSPRIKLITIPFIQRG
jgi:hypothetical protein